MNRNPDTLLASIRGALAYAPYINDLKLRRRYLRRYREQAAAVLILDLLTVEQHDALLAMLGLVQAAINETAPHLPPVLEPVEAT